MYITFQYAHYIHSFSHVSGTTGARRHVAKIITAAAQYGVELNEEQGLYALDIVKQHNAKAYVVVTLLGNGFSLSQIEAFYDCRDSNEQRFSIRLLAEFAKWFGIEQTEELFEVVDRITCTQSEVVSTLCSGRWIRGLSPVQSS